MSLLLELFELPGLLLQEFLEILQGLLPLGWITWQPELSAR